MKVLKPLLLGGSVILALASTQYARYPVTPGNSGAAITGLTGDVSATGPGAVTATVNNVTGGVVGIANGGTGAPSAVGAFTNLSPITTTGDLITGDFSNVPVRLGGDTSDGRTFLLSQSNTGAPQPPSWTTLVAGDIPNISAAKITSGVLLPNYGGTGVSQLGTLTLTNGHNLSLGLNGDTSVTLPTSGTLAALAGSTFTAVPSLGLRDSSAAFDLSLSANSSVTATGTNLLILDSQNNSWTVKLGPVSRFSGLADGTAGKVLSTLGSNSGYSWVTASSFNNPMTTAGDIIYASNTATPATPARLAIGGTNTVIHGGGSPSYSQIVDGDVSSSAGILGSKIQEVGASNAGVVTKAGALLGVADKTDPPTGDVGEDIDDANFAQNAPASGVYTDMTSITLSAGDWEVSGGASFQRNSATFTSTRLYAEISSTAGNTSTGIAGVDAANVEGVAPNGFGEMTVVIPPFQCKCDNTSCEFVDQNLPSRTLFIKLFLGTYTAGTPLVNYYIHARRMR